MAGIKLDAFGLTSFRHSTYSSILVCEFSPHAWMNGKAGPGTTSNSQCADGERLDAGHKAWRATKAAFWAGGFLQGCGKSEPRRTQTACTLRFVKDS